MEHQTTFPFPCGTFEEFHEILSSLELWSHPANGISVDMVHHGFLLGIKNREQLAELGKTWRRIYKEFMKHIEEVLAEAGRTLADAAFNRKKFRPIWDGLAIVGLIYDDPTAATVYLTESARGKGLGKVVTKQLITRGYTVRTLQYCDVADFYAKAGFTAHEGEDDFMRLAPPNH
jgi:GNAT superfamily N-acetyltransferase